MYIPIELLTCIARELNSTDLSNFRLINRKCAQAGISLIPRHGLSVINTTLDLKDLQQILQCPEIANNVKTLRVFQVEWPILSRNKWAYNLLSEGYKRMPNGRQFPSSASAQELCNNAFMAYTGLVREQQNRRYLEEINAWFQILRMLHQLTTIHLSNMYDCLWNIAPNQRYHELRNSIWISPYISKNITRTTEAMLIACGPGMTNLKQLKALYFSGYLDPGELYVDYTTTPSENIEHLRIHDFQMCENERLIRKFLKSFPGLRTLSISFQGWGPGINIFNSLYWHKLEQLDIRGMWTSDSEFVDILERHSKTLKQFGLHNSSLTQGSWQSFFTKIRSLKAQTQFEFSGELYGRTSRETLKMECDLVRSRIEVFLRDHESVWPFSTSNHNS